MHLFFFVYLFIFLLQNNSTDDHVEIQSLWEKDQSRKYFLVIVTVCGSALSVLVTLLSIFVVRRRAYLRNKLRNELNLPKKKKFEDVERLVEGDVEQSRLKRFWNKLFCKKNTEEVSQSHDLTPGNDAEKALSRQSHQDYQVNSNKYSSFFSPNLMCIDYL